MYLLIHSSSKWFMTYIRSRKLNHSGYSCYNNRVGLLIIRLLTIAVLTSLASRVYVAMTRWENLQFLWTIDWVIQGIYCIELYMKCPEFILCDFFYHCDLCVLTESSDNERKVPVFVFVWEQQLLKFDSVPNLWGTVWGYCTLIITATLYHPGQR